MSYIYSPSRSASISLILSATLVFTATGRPLNSSSVGRGFPYDPPTIDSNVSFSSSTAEESVEEGMASAHFHASHIGTFATVRKYLQRDATLYLPLSPPQEVRFLGGKETCFVSQPRRSPLVPARTRNSSMVITSNPLCSTAIASRWKKSSNPKDDCCSPSVLSRRYIRHSEGNTRVHPIVWD